MQTVEATLSLMMFLSVSSAVLSAAEQKPVDDSLYLMQLSNDAWRVLYLRGSLDSLDQGPHPKLEEDLRSLGALSGKCYFISGVEMTNCRGMGIREFRSKSARSIIYEGRPRQVTFSIGK